MKKYMYKVLVTVIVVITTLVSCKGLDKSANVESNEAAEAVSNEAAEAVSNEVAEAMSNEVVHETETTAEPEEPKNAQILRSGVVYTATIKDCGFQGGRPEYLYPDKQHNKTFIKIKAYNDGGITLGFSQMVDTKGWGINMEGELEGRWETSSLSYHDVEYKFAVIKCESACQARVFEDGNHTQVNDILDGSIYHLAVQLIVDPELNIYFSDAALKNHAPDGKLSVK